MPMTPAEWSAVKDILNGALDCPPGDRPAYLDRACGDDGELRRQIESLIEADGQSWNLMEAPAAASSSLTARTRPPASGERIGAYEILREIGHGGMGVVYLARRADDQFEKQVAIKLARAAVAGDPLERRFLAERQIVASLDHPNIARLLDGGAASDGRPYFVMEYVDGRPLTEWCDARGLGTKERLEIFLEVCAAVQYAHQHLVVHRDLKPANVLVTSEGTVKLLDFGIAKLVDEDLSGRPADRTGTLRLLTPDYASPEQVKGGPISTATDVYALGVVLYELLTGERPFRVEDSSPAEMLWTICEREPPKPSSRVQAPRSRQLAGDLDTIVLTALRKEPGRRYASVSALMEDVRCHLAGLPIRARADTFGYRAGKFVRRHRGGVAATVLVIGALAGGLVVSLAEARRARAAEARAERRFDDVRKLARSYLFEVNDAIKNLPGSTPARELIARRALEYLDELNREKGADPGLQRELAGAYEKVADVLGREEWANLGDKAGAQASYRKALEIRQRLAADDPDNRGLLLELASSYDSVSERTKALEIREKVARENPTDIAANKALEISYHRFAVYHSDRKEYEKALAYRQKELDVAEAVRKSAPDDPGAVRDVAIAYKYIGGCLEGLERPLDALEFYRKAAAIDSQRSAAGPAGGPARLDLSFDYAGIGDCLARSGDLAGGLENHSKALALREEVAGSDPKNAWARHSLARAYSKVAGILSLQGSYAGALQGYSSALRIRKQLQAIDPSSATEAFDVSTTLEDIGETHRRAAAAPGQPASTRREHWAEARRSYVESREIALDLQRQGKLPGVSDAMPGRLSAQIARCDEALKSSGS